MNFKKLLLKITLSQIHPSDKNSLLEVLKIRNEESVRINMINSDIIKKNDHLKWVKEQYFKKKKVLFKIVSLDKVIGCVILNNENSKYSWAFYLSENAQKGLGAAAEYLFINYFFDNLKKKNLHCEVLSFNKAVIKMHLRFGFKLYNTKKNYLKRNMNESDLMYFVLDKETWINKKKEISKKFKLD